METLPTYPPCCTAEAIANNTICTNTEAFFYSPAGLAVAAALGVVLGSLFWIISCLICCCSYLCCCVRDPNYELSDSGATDAATDMKYLSMGRNRATLTRMFRLSGSSFRRRNEVNTGQPSGGSGPTPVWPPEDRNTTWAVCIYRWWDRPANGIHDHVFSWHADLCNLRTHHVFVAPSPLGPHCLVLTYSH